MSYKPQIGGLARRVELTLAELGDSLERVQEIGFQMGVDHAREVLREEIRDELRDELENVTDCPMCALQRAFDAACRELVMMTSARDELRAQRRGWSMRQGGARPYFETGGEKRTL